MVSMTTANVKLNQHCYEIYFGQFYVPNTYEECSVHNIVLDAIVVCHFYHHSSAKP